MITLEQMLDSGVHFGHQVRRWNPKMAPFIYGERNGIHIIDILQTLVSLEEICSFLTEQSSQNKTILFVGTKRQAAPIIELTATECNAHYVNQRWLGGMLANWSTMSLCIEQLKLIEKQEEDGTLSQLPKKEQVLMQKRKMKLEKFFGGLKNMRSTPDIVVLVGQPKELNAVKPKIPMIRNQVKFNLNTLICCKISLLQINVKITKTPNHLLVTINKGEISPTADLPAIALNPQKRAAIIKKKCGLLITF